MPVIIGMGEILFDVLPTGKQLGGAPVNFAYHASQFGCESYAVSAVGNDALGHDIMEQLAVRGVRHAIATVPYPTGTVQVTLDAAGVPLYDIREGAAWDNIPFTPEVEQLAYKCQAVCFGSLAQRSECSRSTIYSFLDTMPNADDRYKIFDINLRQHYYSKSIIDNSLRRSNVLKINDEELVTVSRMFGFEALSVEEQCSQLMAKYNLRMLIFTCGATGSYVFTPEAVSYKATPKVEVADTVGAGDSFTGSFIASLLQGKSVKEAHATAVNVSAYVCTQKGAMPVVPQSLK